MENKPLTPLTDTISQALMPYKEALTHRRKLTVDEAHRLKWYTDQPATMETIVPMLDDLFFGRTSTWYDKIRQDITSYAEGEIRSDIGLTCQELFTRLEGFCYGYNWHKLDEWRRTVYPLLKKRRK